MIEIGSLLEAAVRADRLEKNGEKMRLGRELAAEEIEANRVTAIQKSRGESSVLR